MTRTLAMLALCGGSASGAVACVPTPHGPVVVGPAVTATDGHRLLDMSVVSSLPHDVEIFVGVRAAEVLARQLDWDALLARHPKLSAKWTRHIEDKVGRSLLRVSDLSAAGVATERPFGVALLDAERTIACMFAEVHDQTKLDAWLRQLARHQGVDVVVETHGLATIAWTPALPEALMVRRSGHVFVVFGEADATRLREQARRVALVGPERSLASVTAFRALSREVGRGALMATYFRSGALAQKWLGIWDRQADPIFGSLSGAAVGIWSVGDHLRVEGFVALRQDSLVDRALGLPMAASPLHGARARSVVVTASLRRELLGELVRAGYGATGDPVRARAALTDQLELDLEGDVIPHLNGELALMSSRSEPGNPPSLTTSVAVSLLPDHEPVSILEAWPRRTRHEPEPSKSALAPYGLSNRVIWSHGAHPMAADEMSVRGDVSLDRALLTLRHHPTALAMTADASVLPALSGELPSPTWDALCEPLGVLALRANRAERGITLRGALFLRVSNLAAYAEQVLQRLERTTDDDG